MKTFIIEAIVACVLFHIIIVTLVKANPIAWIADYPPKIVARAKELGLIEEVESIKTPKVILRKAIAAVVFALILALIAIKINHVKTFTNGFIVSYGLWFVVAWYDALILDCLWFAHSPKVRIKGTEDMLTEYHNYWFHIKMSCVGSLMGLPVGILAGLFVMLLA